MTREEQREQLVVAALRLAAEHGPGELTVRRIAQAAGMSTMAVYSGLGGRAEELRTAVLDAMSGPLLGSVGGDLRKAYVLWGTMHGLVGLELPGVPATPPPSWGVVPEEGAAERMCRAGVQAVLAGLGV